MTTDERICFAITLSFHDETQDVFEKVSQQIADLAFELAENDPLVTGRLVGEEECGHGY